MLLQEECHKGLNKPTPQIEPMAFATDKWRGHSPKKTTYNGKKPSYFCEHCKIAGHSIERCFKVHGYPNKHKPHQGKKYVAVASNEDTVLDKDAGNQLGLTTE